jgi:tetrapyrrole methylase family protein/MazG family protein/ATP diphosphatase
MAEESGAFDFAGVARASCDKMLRRHPHVFGDTQVGSSAEQTALWEEIKRSERVADPTAGLLDDVPVGLPALTRASKLGKRAASVGFDWPDVAGVRAKVDEELGELDAAVQSHDEPAIAAEMGDLLFTIANWCRHLRLDPESCLRAANEKFAERFRVVERAVQQSSRDWQSYDSNELDALWREAKARSRAPRED